MTARDEIRAASVEHGWNEESVWGGDGRFRYTKPVNVEERNIDSRLVEFADANDIRLELAVTVTYSPSGAVSDAYLQTWNQQTALTGDHQGVEERAEGKGRKEQVLAWLAWG